jgi:hypothetical protein
VHQANENELEERRDARRAMTEEAHELVQEVRLALDRLIQLLDRVLFRSFDTTRDVSIRRRQRTTIS